jgi:hypothetical protein
MYRSYLALALVISALLSAASAQSSCATALDITGKELARKLVPDGPDHEVLPQTFYVDFPETTATGNSTFVLSVLAVLAPQDDLCISATILSHSFSKCFVGLGGINATIATAIQPADQGRAVFNVWYDLFSSISISCLGYFERPFLLFTLCWTVLEFTLPSLI